DLDEDDYGNPNTSIQSCTLPAGYVEDDTDCDDGDASVRPTAIEICDGIDNNCDGDIDDDDSSLSDALLWFLDHDGDGEGDADFRLSLCVQPTGYVDNSRDCNDLSASISSQASEVCDGLDNNCDGLIDDDDPTVVPLVTYYLDLDADGYGDASQTQASCTQPNGYVGDDTDCDDSEAAINPLADEVCDGLDNDCDGAFDDDDADVDLTTGNAYYIDADLDGYGNPGLTEERCALTTGYSELDTDCDDADPDTNPDAVEQCDAVDNDCDGGIDDGTLGSSTACGATSCAEIAQSYVTSSGVYWIDIPSQGVSQVYCDMDVDGGGWTLIEWLDHSFHLSSAASNLSSLFDRSVPAKMSDSDIVSLATAGQNEVMISDGSSTYVLRYSDAEWGSFSSSGWTNVVYDSKGSNGSWSDDICNGHFNNRGFSTYSDSDGSACPIVYSGSSKYYSSYHTSLYSNGVGGAFGVYVR
ncbi:MAG: MopE-related protein, partial [Myxococcota bacterium]|nr:MopE-related protein [Myxococcota bacterium]